MSIFPEPATGFLKEVDDALHEERMRNLWMQYKWVVTALVAGVLVFTVGWQVWIAMQQQQAEESAAAWYVLSQSEDTATDTYKAQLESLSDEGVEGFRALALFTLAEDMAGQKPAEAAAHYLTVANDGSQEDWVRNNARLNAALLLMGTDTDAARRELETLQADEEASSYPLALEMLAVMALNEGNSVVARELTERLLAIAELPPTLRQRGMQRIGALTTLAN